MNSPETRNSRIAELTQSTKDASHEIFTGVNRTLCGLILTVPEDKVAFEHLDNLNRFTNIIFSPSNKLPGFAALIGYYLIQSGITKIINTHANSAAINTERLRLQTEAQMEATQ